MLLAIDIGNTHTVFAAFAAAEIKHVWRLQSDKDQTADEFAALLAPLLSAQNLGFSDFDDVIIGSVVPGLGRAMMELCESYIKTTPIIVNHETAGIDVALDLPDEVGADRLVNARAVLEHYSAPAIVIDFGTATTFDVISAAGAYSGGVIAPGVNLSLEALSRAASKLPKISLQKPEQATGVSTVSAMQSGAYWGYIGLIEKILDKLTAEIDGTPTILATGGLAKTFIGDLPVIKTIDQELTLKGLYTIYKSRKNNEQ